MTDVDTRLDSLEFNVHGPDQLTVRVRRLEEWMDVIETPTFKRILFALDGWPLWRVVERPQWRPWRRWWTS